MTVEEAKFFPTPDSDPDLRSLPLDAGELPSSYGKNRLVLIPVDPYLLYAYWELTPGAPTAGARSILRFHEAPGRPFDVEVDLAAGNWYVHLWSAGKAYQAELGIRSEDGSFVSLAQSNLMRTPPSAPVPAGPIDSDTEISEPHSPEPYTVAEEPVPPSASPAMTERESPAAFAAPAEGALVDAVSSTPTDIPAEPPPAAAPVSEKAPEPSAELDLTEYSERRFTPGISSQDGPLGE